MNFIIKKQENQILKQTANNVKYKFIIGISAISGVLILGIVFTAVMCSREEAIRNEMRIAKSQHSALVKEQLTEASKFLTSMNQELEENKKYIKAIESVREKNERTSNQNNSSEEKETEQKQERELEFRLEALDQQLSGIYLKVSETKKQVEDLTKKTDDVSGITNSTETSVRTSLGGVQNSILQIAAEHDAMKKEVAKLIAQLAKTQEEGQRDLLFVLKQMEQNLNSENEQSSSNTLLLLEKLEEQQNQSAKQTEVTIENNVLNTSERITGEIKLAYDDLKNQQLLLGNQITEQGEGMKTFFEGKDAEMQNYLDNELASIYQKIDTVFGSVSNGKQLLASALLTKGISISKDATFREFEEAIRNIPQEIHIGSGQLPGEISYEYHRHTDGKGNTPGLEEVDLEQNGGCYTTAVYHIHTGNGKDGGGCYSRPVYHTHVDTCYRTTRTKKTITGFQFTGQGTGHACCDDAHGQNWAYCNYRIDSYVNEVLVSSTNGREELGYCCGNCIEKTAMEKGYQSTQVDIICGEKEGLSGYETECGMTNDSIVSYKPSCGFVDQQIIGAHIWYQQDRTTDENSMVSKNSAGSENSTVSENSISPVAAIVE